MPRLKNPVQQRRESLRLSRAELAQKAGMSKDTLLMVEGGANLLLSSLVATKFSRIFKDVTPEKLIEEYALWRCSLETERRNRL